MRSKTVLQGPRLGWLRAALPGAALVAVSLMLAVLFGVLDAARYGGLKDFFTPDPVAAAGVLAMVGGAEGVTISIVIVAVVFGIQMTSSRYSPRIIALFTRNLWNALVLGISLASILYTFLIRAEVKPNYVPMWSVAAAEVLALVNFAILLPYVGYIFEVMRAETLVESIRRRAGRELRAAVAGRDVASHRRGLMTALAQVTDIALGSIQLGDMPVCVLSIEVAGRFLADDYIKVKSGFAPSWFVVGHAHLPGASDQIVAEVNRARTWVEYTVLSSFVDMAGLTPVYRREAMYAISLVTRDLGLAAIAAGDHEAAELCVRFFNTYLRVGLNRASPTFASSIMNEYRRLAIGSLEWRPDLAVEAAAHLLSYGRHFDQLGMPAIFGAAAEDVADLAIEAEVRDHGVTQRLARLLVDNLAELLPDARPIGLNGLFKAVSKLAFWAMAAGKTDVAEILVAGIAAAPPDFVEAALNRMETLRDGLFWEVNERVVAFDWVDPDLRSQIPALRCALRERGRPQPVDGEQPGKPISGARDLVQPV
ncbi:MAG TPA: DUF2254 family protein [Candidatus Dormibacteraeota bacterium]|nr:DUF2254 family protein [Candidatus Dormibacteraeota bacterium]